MDKSEQGNVETGYVPVKGFLMCWIDIWFYVSR